jgi:hypothetical protein
MRNLADIASLGDLFDTLATAPVSRTTWHGDVTYQASPTEEQAKQVMTNMPGWASVGLNADRNHLTISTHLEAPTLRQATELLLRQVREAVRAADVTGEPVSTKVKAAREVQAELRRPLLPKLAGMTEVGELLGVTRQRAAQLATREDFPLPVTRLAAGPIWTRDSVEAFAQRWPRRRTGRPRKTA